MEEEIFITDSEGVYPVLLIPKKCTSLETNCEATDNVFVNVNITSPDTEGNEMSIYSGFCNVKLIDSYDVNINEGESQSSDSNDNHPIEISECNQAYPPYSQSQVWIDPVRSPFVYNSYDVEAQERYSVYHQSCSSHITVEQHKTYITQNVYNYKESIQYSPMEEFEHKKFGKIQTNEAHPQSEQNLYENDEFECGVFLSHLPEEIMNEKENKAREEMKYIGIQSENDALKQLMSSDIQSLSKQQKTILYLGHDSHYGQTVQKISLNNPALECVDNNRADSYAVEDNPNQKKYQCDKCKQIFLQIAEFKQHMVNHKSPKISVVNSETLSELKFMCIDCGKILKNQKKFELHCLGHGNPELECNKCSKVFASKFTLRNHTKIHQRKHGCTHCTKAYSTFEELKSHTKNKHFIFICDMCDFTANNHNDLEIHKLCHKDPNETEFTLSLEDDLLSNSDTLTPPHDHSLSSYADETSNSDKIKKAEMVISQVMSNKIFLLHSKKARKHKRYKKTCNVCMKTFDRVGDLKRHLIEHVIRSTLAKTPVNKNGTLTIQCEVCRAETFTKVDRYKAHLREHAKLTLYKCTFCDKSFSDSSNFSKHKKIHATAFFQCDLCHRKFNSKKMITQHMEYHNNNSPIPCMYCDKEFHFPSMLNKHVKCAHTRELTRFRCCFCQEYFKSLKEKWDHEWRIHNVRKMIVDCLICGSKFRKYSELKRHCNEQHNMEIPPAKKLLKKRRYS